MSLWIGIESTQLSANDCKRLTHPLCSGVVLFSRNYENLLQLQSLCQEIKTRFPKIIIAVDHEGGRVQRFKDSFTHLPYAALLGEIYNDQPETAFALSWAVGVIASFELRDAHIDLNFAPVLDLNDPISSVIGDRAYHHDPSVVSLLALAYRQGARLIGCASVGKHYPGHGTVQGDSHHLLPKDSRSTAQREADYYPFRRHIESDIEAMMMAHILFPEDEQPCSFSSFFHQQLRDFGFKGAMISDDLDMAGGQFFADPITRIKRNFQAGSDIAMVCNDFQAMDKILSSQDYPVRKESAPRIERLRAKPFDRALSEPHYQQALSLITPFISV